ncbi:esterase family protein [Fulvivirga sp. M361]|uniref:alpha/beta hydrolase n=1 Tax=Fulvivirga sp. M361 TaxID=2594266 RepID=UPI001627B588|nr:alpha/beta hydrolase-fold protein [Fulvivirga sp. M361]
MPRQGIKTACKCPEDTDRKCHSQRYGNKTLHYQHTYIPNKTIPEYYLYVPAQYDGKSDAALMVFQDGWVFADKDHPYVDKRHYAPDVFDELIHANKMPVTIAIFAEPGNIDEDYPENRMENSKRSEEYDELSDRYVSFLINTLIPEVAKYYRLTDDPMQRAIGGFSSGGNCSFTAAWQRPDYFHRVLSFAGAYINIRGGHIYPYLVRSSPKKDLKVYLQAGSNDIDIIFGNVWLANQQMAAAFKFKGYDYKFVRTEGTHGQFMGEHFKGAIEWLWDDSGKESSNE